MWNGEPHERPSNDQPAVVLKRPARDGVGERRARDTSDPISQWIAVIEQQLREAADVVRRMGNSGYKLGSSVAWPAFLREAIDSTEDGVELPRVVPDNDAADRAIAFLVLLSRLPEYDRRLIAARIVARQSFRDCAAYFHRSETQTRRDYRMALIAFAYIVKNSMAQMAQNRV
ncbi:MAG: hypothetical protein IPK59_10385 [Rhodospirillaceae bacterium]|nr:hypothetical protein [Rhodospirillaceae bacterium]